ncbi:MAG: RHS repeat-associated core domain-containing protein, partial [Clostridia bacterium]|nr:RHS repeat-associated core domain-containing protein [Clostridia bacterium]
YYDEESGLYYLRARYYDPVVGRFITKDSYEGDIANPLSLNQYTYCHNDPVNYTDYNGQNPVAVIYMYCVTVTRAPDTQIDMQCIALDLSQGNYFAAAFDGAGVLLPGVTGVGKAADDTAKAVWIPIS